MNRELDYRRPNVDKERVEAALRPHLEAGECVGLTWLVADDDGVTTGALGSFDDAGERAVGIDTIYRIASLSKPVVAAAALLLCDTGELAVDEPIDRLVPELADRRVLTDPAGPLDDTVAADRPITVEDLLTSRLGLGWDFSDTSSFDQPAMALLGELGLGAGPPQPQALPPSDEWLSRFGTVPLERQPGECWLYDTSLLVLGVVVERATGMKLGEALSNLIFEPLGMTDTSFAVADESSTRLGACFADDGEAGARRVYDPADGQWRTDPPFHAGNGGLLSTVTDYFTFADALRHDDLLTPETFTAMTTNHLTADQLAGSAPEPGGGLGWGYGLGVRVGGSDLESPGTYGWDGGLGATWRTDPDRGIVAILLTNTAWLNPLGVPLRESFWHAVLGH